MITFDQHPHLGYRGVAFIESPLAVKRGPQFRFPRSKKKRIRNKWAKRDRNYRWEPHGYMVDDKFIVHPAYMAKLRTEMAAQIQRDLYAQAEQSIISGTVSAPQPVPVPGPLTAERLAQLARDVRIIAARNQLMYLALHNALKPSVPTFPYTPS